MKDFHRVNGELAMGGIFKGEPRCTTLIVRLNCEKGSDEEKEARRTMDLFIKFLREKNIHFEVFQRNTDITHHLASLYADAVKIYLE